MNDQSRLEDLLGLDLEEWLEELMARVEDRCEELGLSEDSASLQLGRLAGGLPKRYDEYLRPTSRRTE